MRVWEAVNIMSYVNDQGGRLKARRPNFGTDSFVCWCDNIENIIFFKNNEIISITGSADKKESDWQVQVLIAKILDRKMTGEEILLGTYEKDVNGIPKFMRQSDEKNKIKRRIK